MIAFDVACLADTITLSASFNRSCTCVAEKLSNSTEFSDRDSDDTVFFDGVSTSRNAVDFGFLCYMRSWLWYDIQPGWTPSWVFYQSIQLTSTQFLCTSYPQSSSGHSVPSRVTDVEESKFKRAKSCSEPLPPKFHSIQRTSSSNISCIHIYLIARIGPLVG